VGINQGNPAARLHISDQSTNCAPSLLIDAYSGTLAPPGGEDPNLGESTGAESTCTTPYAFRVNTYSADGSTIMANLKGNGAFSLGAIYDFTSTGLTKLSVQDNLGLYRSNSQFLRLGFSINGQGDDEPLLKWHHDEGKPFHIGYGTSYSDASKLMSFQPTGQVGIGTENPETALHIRHTEEAANEGPTGQVQGLLIENNGFRNHDYALEVRSGNGKVFTVGNYGTVHIGDQLNWSIPDENFRLWVEGGIRTERVKVDVASDNGWADYVFEDDYELMPIDELEAYIKEHKHLPGVPSSEEVKREGIDVAEMNKILLEKIEDLTLRVIELEKEAK